MTITALVVDNNPVVLRAISVILEKEGCKVHSVANGLEALNLLKHITPDIIFTDLVMPLIGGEQLCKIIRSSEHFKHVYLVVISGIVLEDIENILAEKYYDQCIAKGNLKELRSHIKDALKSFSAERDNRHRLHGDALAKIPEGLLPSSVTTELLSEKRHLSRILENLEEGIVELNQNGVVVSLNGAAQRLLAVREENIIGSSFADYPWGELQERIRIWLTVQLPEMSAEHLNIQEDFPLRRGERILTASFIPVRDKGAVFGLCILRDITRQYRAEEHERDLNNAIKLVTKMEAMSYMAGGIAHDFNNLLTVICGNLDILRHAGFTTQETDRGRLLEHARSAAYMAVDLTRKISQSSPFGIVSRQKHIFEQIVEDTLTRFADENLQEFTTECIGERSLVSVNPDQISAALTSILQNAVEAGGTEPIRVITRNVEFQAPSIISGQYVPAGEYACVSVQDSGQGIDRQHLLKIFDPYFSTKARGVSKGMGLGLTVVYATMRNHGGYVVVESSQGKGTIVSCYLPRYGQVTEDAETSSSGTSRHCRVLFVENDVQLQEVGRIMLEYLGYDVTIAENLRDALAHLVSGALDKGDRVKVVMIDPSQELYNDHQRICSSLAELDGELRIVVTGGSMLDPVMRDCRRFGYANALSKPFTLDSLKHVLMTVTN